MFHPSAVLTLADAGWADRRHAASASGIDSDLPSPCIPPEDKETHPPYRPPAVGSRGGLRRGSAAPPRLGAYRRRQREPSSADSGQKPDETEPGTDCLGTTGSAPRTRISEMTARYWGYSSEDGMRGEFFISAYDALGSGERLC